MIEPREKAITEAAVQTARLMAAAAISAPKASGNDTVQSFVLTGEEKDQLAQHMRDIAEETGAEFFARDAGNVDRSEAVVLIGVRNVPFGLDHCGYCGFRNCAEMTKAGANCALTITDLGIAVGSAVSIAADHRMDNRVMFSAGQSALRMGFFDPSVRVSYGIPISVTSKSIYFDRDPGAVLF
ncbi:MAG: ferredoxin [Firmicutes bacterium]|nr:ferredoxin [Bacillota bacterium]